MHTMKFNKDNKTWIVGFFEPVDDGGEDWCGIAEFDTQTQAGRYVNYLNGGPGNPFAWVEDTK
jgi:hypothetical protein